jgi:hypothetical protein
MTRSPFEPHQFSLCAWQARQPFGGHYSRNPMNDLLTRLGGDFRRSLLEFISGSDGSWLSGIELRANS